MPTRTLLCWMIWRLRCRYRLKSFVAVSGLPCPLLTLLSDVIAEVSQQKKDRAAKWLRILCLSIFSVILLAFLFFTGAFLFIQNEANLDEALFTLALGAFAIGLMLFRYGIPILLLAIALPPLLCRRPRQPAETIVCILLSVLSVLWLIFGGHFLWFQLF